MSNIAGKCYAMNVFTPLYRRHVWLKKAIFMTARVVPSLLSELLGLSIIHFARWVIIKRDQWPDLGQGKQHLEHDYMLFLTNFNGTWDQYIDAFSDGVPNGLDLFWYLDFKYPQSIPIAPFKDYIVHNQIKTDYYYNATPGAAQRDIKSALRVWAAVRELAHKHKGASPDAFAAEYRRRLYGIQTCLGSTGLGPVASLDTEKAEINRQVRVAARWQSSDAAD
jgi:hypothetical protein